MRLLLIGSIPPPQGGIGVHVDRLGDLLKEHDYDVRYLDESPEIKPSITNIRSLNIVKIIKEINLCDIMHIHTSIDILRICYILAGMIMRKKFVVTIHSWRGKSSNNQAVQKMFLRKANKVICVNDSIKNCLSLKNIVVRNAFIPPNMLSQPALPKKVEQWLADKTNSGKTIISSNAFRLDKHDGVDLYGLDMTIELAKYLLKDEKRNVAFVFCVASTKGRTREIYDSYVALIEKYGLRENFLLITKERLSFVRILLKSNLTIRATNTDGDALSIRESLYFGVPVIASNCINRPVGTITFETRNQSDLNSKVLQAIETYDSSAAFVHSKTKNEDFDFYNDLYLP